MADNNNLKVRLLQLILAGCPKHLFSKLQKVQNNDAGLIFRSTRSTHITPMFILFIVKLPHTSTFNSLQLLTENLPYTTTVYTLYCLL